MGFQKPVLKHTPLLPLKVHFLAHNFSHSASLQADKNKQSTLPVQIELSAITSQSTSWHVHMCVVEMLTGATISLWRKNTRLMHKHTHTAKINWVNTHCCVLEFLNSPSVRSTNHDLWPGLNMSIHHNYSTQMHTDTHLVEVRVRYWLMLVLVIITHTEGQSTAKWPIKTDQLENTFYRSAEHITRYLISLVSSGTKFAVCVCALLKSCHLSSHQVNQAKMSWIIINHQPFPYTNTHLCSALWESAWMKG